MSVRIDSLISNVISRQPVPASGLMSGEEKAAHGRPLDSLHRVEPVEKSEKGRATEDERLREDRPEQAHEQKQEHRQERDESSVIRDDAEEGRYDRQLNYEPEVNRVYLDIVRDGDELVMRIPSEKVVEYLDQAKARSAGEDPNEAAPRIRQSV